MKWYENVVIMLVAILSNAIVSVNVTSEYHILVVLVTVSLRGLWTIAIYFGLHSLYKKAKGL